MKYGYLSIAFFLIAIAVFGILMQQMAFASSRNIPSNSATSQNDTLTVNILISPGNVPVEHVETITANAAGGTPSGYTLNIINASGLQIYSNSINTTSSSATFSWNAVIAGQFYANVSVQSNSVANQIISQNVPFTVEPGLALNSTSLKSNAITAGHVQEITVNISGGAAPYVYNYTVYNDTNAIVANAVHLSSLTSNTLMFNQSANFGVGNFIANVIVIDSSNEIVSAVRAYTVGKPLQNNGSSSMPGNIVTSFSENGLPANVTWSVAYNGVTQNSLTPSSINFFSIPGNYTFNIDNVTVSNAIYAPAPQSGLLDGGNTIKINFMLISSNAATTTIIPSTPNISVRRKISPPRRINSINTFIGSLSSKGIPIKSLFMSNSSITGINENGTVANVIDPIILNYQQMSNLTSLNQTQLDIARSKFNKIVNYTALYSFNRSIQVPYGNIVQAHRFAGAGSVLHYVAYNTHGIVTYYNVSIMKAQPRLAINVNGAVMATPNTTSIIHVPILKGQKTYSVSLSLNSSLAQGNAAGYSYEIRFSNGTTISNSVTANNVSYSNTFILPTDQNATITFGMNGNSNYTAVDPTTIVIPTSIEYYVPITLTNSQTSATPAPFQQMLSVNSLTYNAYEADNLNNIEFFYFNGTLVPSWMEGSTSNTLLNNPTNSIDLYTSTNTIYWLNISGGIPASNSITVYMGFAPVSTNLFNNINVGEAPQISNTYAQYDDGNYVFLYYNVNPTSTTGWTIAGTAGQTPSAPSGSHFATTNALYANSANGDYMYTSIPALTSNIIISYNVYTTGLGDFFFLTNSAGNGQITRLDGRGGGDLSGLATSSSWTAWTAPSQGLSETTGIWYKYDTVISGSSAYAYIGSISNNLATYGTATSSSAFTISNDGNYIGLIGDALGSSYITYWNGMIIRTYPPNGVMPSATFGSIASSNVPVLTFQSNPAEYGTTDTITATATTTGDSVEIENNGNLIAVPAANTISYNICDTTPSLSNCWIPGNYIITANDITNGYSTNAVLTVNKGIPALTLSATNVILDGGSGITVDYGISTVSNQLSASLIVNGANVASTSSSSAYSFVPNNGLNTFEVTTAGNGDYSASSIIKQSCVVPTPSGFPGSVLYYAPLCVINSQTSATPSPFQAMINITESAYAGNLVYNGNLANFEIFNAIGAVQPAWIESNQSGKLVTWVKLANGIAANSISPLYLGFASSTFNTLSSSGTNGIGEIPTASSTYAEYDDGASVFNNYFAGNSLSGWTTAGTAGQTSSAPSGSPFGTDAFYANGANGDYLDAIANGQSGNMIIEYYTDTANLDDVFFLVDSAGAGQIGRVGNGGGWYGVASASSWTSWTAPPDTGEWSNKWILTSIAVTSGDATMYVSATPGIYGSEIGQNTSNTYTTTDEGSYLGLVGDAAGGTTTQYWNGMIIRAYPPNGVMPSSLFGSAIPVQKTCTISLTPSAIDFGSLDSGSSISTVNAITDDNTGNTNAYMLVYGGNWIGPASLGVSNTTWDASNDVAFPANRLSALAYNTTILVPASSSNDIYFGLGIPGGAPAGAYSQDITIENSC